jgi:hypothetical protein
MDTVHTDLNAMNNESFRISDRHLVKDWKCEQFFGEWIPGRNSYGRGFLNSEEYWLNPQFKLKIPKIRNQDTTSLIVSLMQTDSFKRRLQSADPTDRCLEAICFKIFLIKEGTNPNENNIYNDESLEYIDRASHYCHYRDVSERFELKPNSYIIIPSLYEKNLKAKFLLRCFYETESSEITRNSKPKPLLLKSSNKISPTTVHNQQQNIYDNFEQRNSTYFSDKETTVLNAEPVIMTRNHSNNEKTDSDCSAVCSIL